MQKKDEKSKKKSFWDQFFGGKKKKDQQASGPGYDYLFKLLVITGNTLNSNSITPNQPPIVTDITLSEKESIDGTKTKIRIQSIESMDVFLPKSTASRNPRPPHGCVFYLANIDEDLVKDTLDKVRGQFGDDMPIVLVGSPIHSGTYNVTSILDSSTSKIDVLRQISQICQEKLQGPTNGMQNN